MRYLLGVGLILILILIVHASFTGNGISITPLVRLTSQYWMNSSLSMYPCFAESNESNVNACVMISIRVMVRVRVRVRVGVVPGCGFKA